MPASAPPPLGQHFLADAGAVRRVVAAARLRPGETVLDVGAGEGALTRAAAEAVAPGGRVVAVEVDARLAAGLRREALPGVDVWTADALAVPLPRADAVVANPPFRIAAPLVRRLLDAGFGRAVLVLPSELVERLVARPSAERYGRLTVEVAVRADVTPLFRLPRGAFAPPPQVGTAVVRLDPKPPPDVDPERLAAVLEAAWAAKRRTLRHALGPLPTAWRSSSGELTRALRELGVESAPATAVPPEAFVRIAQALGGGRKNP